MIRREQPRTLLRRNIDSYSYGPGAATALWFAVRQRRVSAIERCFGRNITSGRLPELKRCQPLDYSITELIAVSVDLVSGRLPGLAPFA